MNDEGPIFDWDEANKKHLAKHNVTPGEAKQAITGDPLDIELQTVDDAEDEERLLQIGQTAKGRILQLVTTWREGKVRVISAWDAPRQVKQYYLAEMRRQHGNVKDPEV
jgi:uncharacterized protein